MIKIAPSILSADFSILGKEVKDVEKAGADYIHIDVMDGHFVPNITIGPLIVEAIRPVTSLPFDVHLMIENPEKYIQNFVRAGADIISVHTESCRHLHRTIYQIKEQGIKAGVVLNPATPVEMIRDVLTDIDLVLLMTVNPGFGGQTFIPNVLKKIEQVKRWKDEQNLTFEIEVDGGINDETAKQCVEKGVDVLVAGSYIFNNKNREQAIEMIRTRVSEVQ
ncbi:MULTISPECIES: ribulose-phosphate 3-epimerase [Bacillaceae]|uniref:Ribulose-phosphate 3-epimerase n=1 Tax=Caldifermentibacillus hisashii TaxID=996558 RepID=A0ABU9JWF4_9BACI|nr:MULTISPECIES: ribulose-phosphate 3-epimerase [Bacillaceae]MBU5341167.1 ribulose-phosphate 3-epimerase [Caldifermentibacillus hisashii]MCM3053569.1 ribulose-phosphate 3-epimerase [Caldibacillus thermoamylovorans]MCM3797639.1 ribulose-phosphate 3-epimerase [Caldibacillus thermoamylovorans]MDL0418513.1 ribulose-phosphate 3-epimerase [Caldibacillus thermoamylovorans]MEC5271394.1 ribulose-phosphate 3-epimerase [Caldifermentibacillus hisashii]